MGWGGRRSAWLLNLKGGETGEAATKHVRLRWRWCRSLSVAGDGSMVVAANQAGTAYVWRMLRGASVTTHFEPLHKLRAHQSATLHPLR